MASGNGISGLLNFKIFWGSMPPVPLDTGVSGAPLPPLRDPTWYEIIVRVICRATPTDPVDLLCGSSSQLTGVSLETVSTQVTLPLSSRVRIVQILTSSLRRGGSRKLVKRGPSAGRREPLGGSGGMPPLEILKFGPPKTAIPCLSRP